MSSISLEVSGAECRIRVRGDLDADTVLRLRGQITRAFARYGSIGVDLSEVKAIDQSGHALVALLCSIVSPMFRVSPPPGMLQEETACRSPS